MPRYTISEKAERDLAEMWRFSVRRWGRARADTYFQAIISALDALADRPSLGLRCDDIRGDYFRYKVGSHLVFFKRLNGVPQIVRILHAQRDFRRHLPKD